ncbi:hypothetical protein DICVIV_12910 [Dictyocaulus viviparus]|uniref:Uncharacterized protein n=1 Tax=Dictyocaulus viviparus TaxID=29172 RepID=A0A0D8XFA1_DICVI|nr:hypothetical protein DICVIV_12910 [Dictyocaulus viviparus]
MNLLFIGQMDLSISNLITLYTSNLLWSIFLTSTALHAIALITSPMQAVLKWYRRQSSDSDTCLPYLCAVIGQVDSARMEWSLLVRRLIRLVFLITITLFFIFYYIQGLNEDDGKELETFTNAFLLLQYY